MGDTGGMDSSTKVVVGIYMRSLPVTGVIEADGPIEGGTAATEVVRPLPHAWGECGLACVAAPRHLATDILPYKEVLL